MTLLVLWLLLAAPAALAEFLAGPAQAGQFWRVHWYKRGLEHGNPAFEKRFRVNSPEAVLHPEFGKRVEARENGLMLILAEEDLSLLAGAELSLEMWGGHPGTANKRVSVNGRSIYLLPLVGTEEMNCTYHYPVIPLKISDLVNGYNAFQFAVDQGRTFWGHMIVDNACLRAQLAPQHPDLARARLTQFQAAVNAQWSGAKSETLELSLGIPGESSAISRVDYQGHYRGYDENGDAATTDWHGFTKARSPVAMIGSIDRAPFQVTWDTRLLPAQSNVSVRAVVHFKEQTNLVYVTAPLTGITISERPGRQVTLYASRDLPKPFWSRAGRKLECTIELDLDPTAIELAELHVNAWTGGSGGVSEYFKLNGQHYPVAEGSRHELIYSRLAVDPKVLKKGANRIELLSDTEHHGIEILLPGPCLMIRSE